MVNVSIGRVSALTGLSPKTIRFYEDSGIISAPARSPNGYRTYPPSAITELQVIRYAREMGLPLSEIRKLMIGCDHGDCNHSRNYLESSIDTYLQTLDGKILEMTRLKTQMIQLKAMLARETSFAKDKKYCCNILHQLVDMANNRKGGV
jgi:MerR family transcriptional regulator, copper efflux regulator